MDRYKNAVSETLDDILRASSLPFNLHAAETSAESFLTPAQTLATGGKRTRALFALAGWQAGAHLDIQELAALPTCELPVNLGAALELYQLSALVHDDIIDAATTRRGAPTAHIAFARAHRAASLEGNAEMYGTKMAILLGDYLLSLASHTLSQAVNRDEERAATPQNTASAQRPRAVSQLFDSMAAEVAFGPFTEVYAEYVPLNATDDSEAISCALTVLYHKAARYSVTVPALLGAQFAGADAAVTSELERLCSPLGEAFQLRDDALGVFGEPSVTGKPAGGDITEGKRTVLLALTRAAASPEDKTTLDSMLGHELSPEQLDTVRIIMQRSGAAEEHEAMIKERENIVASELRTSNLHLDILEALAASLTKRSA